MQVLRYFILARLASICLAVSTHDEAQNNLEITPGAHATRIVRNEKKGKKPSSLMQNGQGNPAMELNPDLMGDEASTTMIVQSGAGPTTTAIYAVGSGPLTGPAKNAIDLTPAPPNYYEPGPPGIPGPPGPPGPPGDPGPAEGGVGTSAPTTEGPLLHSAAGVSSVSAAPLGVHTQSGYEIRGPPGGPGPVGPQGEQGVIGSQGLEGALGERGMQGYPGPKGEHGIVGKRQHVNAPRTEWMYYAFAVNIVFAIIILVVSYVEFVKRSSISECCCGRRKEASGGGGESWGEGYGGYENQ